MVILYQIEKVLSKIIDKQGIYENLYVTSVCNKYDIVKSPQILWTVHVIGITNKAIHLEAVVP